ncbi:phage minor head protein [Methylobacterium aquaticum]|uniref:phage head morphogenesis protein n=1 Tax=Methylobacterium aquaticum TaxID=270351 RepID=UPI003D16D3E4
MAQPARGFRVPPEVPRYFAEKGLKPAFSWLDVWGEEHAYAFTVAKATDLELLTLLRDSIARAIDAGQGFETWRANLLPELERLGWARPRRVADPAGQRPDAMVNFAAPGRLQTIFSSNMRSARAAGQWERIQRTKGALPYLLYVRSASAEPRVQHLAWAGIILPADDPWWSTHFPPNGWGCKCGVRQISRAEREQKLRTEGYGDERPPLNERPFLNTRTGEVVQVPDGIDPGWQTNPGLARARTLVTRMSQRLAEAGAVEARAAIADLWASPVPRVIAGLPAAERVQLPIAVAPEVAKALDAASPLISVSRDTLAEKLGHHRDRPTEVATFARAQELIDAGVVRNRGQTSRRTVVTERADGWWGTTIARSVAGFLRVVSIHRVRKERALGWLKESADEGP